MGRTERKGDMDWLLGNVFLTVRNMERVYRTAYGTHTAESCGNAKTDKCGKNPDKRL